MAAGLRARGRRAAPRPTPTGSAPIVKDLQAHAGATALVLAGETPAARGPRARARDQRGARQRRQDRHLHRARRGAARSTRRRRSPSSSTDMDAGQVEVLVILGGNPAYDGARRPRRSPRRMDKVAAPRPPRPLRRRDRRALPLARARGPPARGLERRARVRRHGHRSCSRSSRRSTAASPAHEVLAALRRAGADARATTSSASTGRTAARRGRLRASAGGARSTTASSPGTALPDEGGRRSRPGDVGARRRARPRPRDGLELVVPPRPERLRRPLREQRLAAGAAASRSPSSPGTTPPS